MKNIGVNLSALAMLLASCSETLPELPPPCTIANNCASASGESCIIASAEEKGYAYEVICEGEHVGYLDNGKPGEKGERGLAGTKGEDCAIDEASMIITCAALKLPLSHGILGEDGEPGIDGADGKNCEIFQTSTGVEITCDGVEFSSFDHGGGTGAAGATGATGATGPTGATGQNCEIDDTTTGVVITCDDVVFTLDPGKGEKGEKGGKGLAGRSCTIAAPTPAGVEIICGTVEQPDTLTLRHGTDGKDGSVITIVDGYWYIDGTTTGIKAYTKGDDCTVVDRGNRFAMICGGTKTAEWPKAMCRATAYDPYSYECRTGNKIYLTGGIVDSRDGQTYEAVLIGTQTWMAQNLNYNATGSKCYDDNDDYCDIYGYGRLYKYDPILHAMVCPAGWHLPSVAEWNTLMNFINPSCSSNTCADAGTKLKATSGWSDGNNGTDDFGFSALPSNSYSENYGRFDTTTTGWWALMNYSYAKYITGSNVGNIPAVPSYWFSVRCMMDSKCGNFYYNPNTQFCDSRGSKVYKKVKIGNQTWMAENLNHNADSSKCYNDLPTNCGTYGRLYNWETANEVCPNGWHLPSDDEWSALENAVGGRSTAGKYLKTATWGGLDTYGFAALPGGHVNSDGNFINAGISGYWWSSIEKDSIFAYRRGMSSNDDNAFWVENEKSFMFSVRCVED